MNDLSHLNSAQREAVLHTEGPLLIVAGAGAGKTKTLTERIVHLILGGVHPNNILAVTFTNKASGEMRERVEAAIRKQRIEGMPTVTTFHRLGGSIIRDHAGYFGLTKYFSIFDEDDGKSLIKEAMREFGIDPKLLDPKRVKHIISQNKMAGETPDTLSEKVASQAESDAVRIWRSYEQKLAKSKGVDFDDLIVKAVRLLEKEPAMREEYQKKWPYIHVDEYQDTNEMEYRMVKLLAGEKKNICVVGDTDQNIYSWRGAKIKNMLHFEKDFPGAHTVFLEQNYRSTSRILEAANAVIIKNTVRLPKNLFTELGTGEKLVRYEGFSETDEGAFIARECEKLIASGIQAEEIAVLFRANFQSRVLEEAFLYASVPYRVIGTQFFERAEVKDVIAYIRASVNRDSLADIKRTIGKPPRGIGDSSVAKIFAGMHELLTPRARNAFAGYEKILDTIGEASQTEYPSELVRKVLDLSGLRAEYESEGEQGIERIENVGELATLASLYDTLPLGEGVQKFLEDAALRSDSDALAESPEGVRLLTVHASKGLEFRAVFIVGLEEGLFPHERASRSAKIEDAEEERRLFYVALTRAKERIYLTHAQSRTIFGSRNINMPSQFLFDIPHELIELHTEKQQRDMPSFLFD
jgi:DNA helicase-2/ATP-dependent DNA helicase PcrA